MIVTPEDIWWLMLKHKGLPILPTVYSTLGRRLIPGKPRWTTKVARDGLETER
jgi:hypothetical protein